MKRMLENMTGNYSTTASVVDGTLILSLPDALTPVVWRLDLGHAKASALEVREDAEGSFVLLLKTPRGDVNDIARFATRGRAVTALMSVTRAMEQSHGQFRPAAYEGGPYNAAHLPVPVRRKSVKAATAHGHGNGKGLLGGLVAIALIIILGGIILNMGPKPVSSNAALSPAAGIAPSQAAGVPVSADDFLTNR